MADKLGFSGIIELCFVGAGFHARPQIYGYRVREGTETLPYNTRHKIMLLYYFFPVNRKHNERESRAQGAACCNIVR